MKKTILIALFFCFVSAFQARAGGFDPWDFSTGPAAASSGRGAPPPATGEKHALTSPLRSIFRAVSAVDGDRCPMTPTCSSYALQAMDRHGFFIGTIMAADRLIHEWDEQDLAPRVLVGGEYRAHDPVSANDFWWTSGTSLDK